MNKNSTLDLNEFPNIFRAYSELHFSVRLEDCYIKELLEIIQEHSLYFDLNEVDECLGLLYESGLTPSHLMDQVRSLFSPQKAAWDQANTELLTYTFLVKESVLDKVGYIGTPGNYRFEGLLSDNAGSNKQIAFDVKPAVGGGLGLLRAEIGKIIETWQDDNDIAPLTFELKYEDSITQETVRDAIKTGVIDSFKTSLDKSHRIPDQPTKFSILGGTVSVEFKDYDGGPCDSGMMFVDPLCQKIGQTLVKHVRAKATNSKPFVLFYINPSGRGGADFDEHKFLKIMRQTTNSPIPGEEWWLGSIFISFNRSESVNMLFERPASNWPNGSTGRTLAKSLNIDDLFR